MHDDGVKTAGHNGNAICVSLRELGVRRLQAHARLKNKKHHAPIVARQGDSVVPIGRQRPLAFTASRQYLLPCRCLDAKIAG
jgi:hypothetical protein